VCPLLIVATTAIVSLFSIKWFVRKQIVLQVSFFFSVALRPNTVHGLLILEFSRSHTTSHHSR
jgi:hypothetical protein